MAFIRLLHQKRQQGRYSRAATLLDPLFKQRLHVRTLKAHRVNLGSDANQGFPKHLIRELFVTSTHTRPNVIGNPFVRVTAVRELFAHGDRNQPLVEPLAFFETHVLCHVYRKAHEPTDSMKVTNGQTCHQRGTAMCSP